MVRSRLRQLLTSVLPLVSFRCLAPLGVACFTVSRPSVLRQRGKGLSSLSRKSGGMKSFDYSSFSREFRKGRSNNRFSSFTRLGATVGGDESEESARKERDLGVLVLFSVPLAWGTFEPAVRYVYAIEPPVPSLVFTVGYYFVASLTLLILAISSISREEGSEELASKYENKSVQNEYTSNQITADGFPIRGGIELGTYLFFGNGLQVIGLKTVPSDRAAFLLQLTTIMVPLVQAIIAGDMSAIPTRTWIACFVALGGVAVMSLDGQELMDDGSALSFSGGDFLIVLAAFSYTFHCIRLGKYAKETTPIKLGATKATTEAVLSAALLAVIMLIGNTVVDGGSDFLSGTVQARNEIVSWFTAIVDGVSSGSTPASVLLPAVGAVLWTGLVTIAYTITAQSYGQRTVNPTTANLIYTMQPIFTALFAWALLGETLGPAGYAGGGLILYAVYLVANMEEDGEGIPNAEAKHEN